MRSILVLFCLLYAFTLAAQKHTVYFESAEDTISNSEAITLDSVLQLLDPFKAYIVEITGHTDSIGSIKYNQALSKRRAQTIQQYINQSKRSFDISVLWSAFFDPANPNTSDEGLARNRRVEITFTEVIPKKDTWHMPVQEFGLDNSKAYILHTQNGCKLRIKPNSFQVNIGDTVRVLITEYNNPADFLAGGLPMSYAEGQQEFMYQSEQMMKIEAIANGNPVQLLQMIGLECPDIELSEGLRLYKFQGKETSFVNIESRKTLGFAEEVEPETLDDKGIKIDTLSSEKPTKNKEKNNQNTSKDETSSKKQTKSKTTKISRGNSSSTSSNKNPKTKQKKRVQKKKKIKKKRPYKNGFGAGPKRSSNSSKLTLEPDTGRAFILIPDTGFLLEPDTGWASSHKNKPDDCTPLPSFTEKDLCNIDTFKKIVDFGYRLNNPNSTPIELDLDLNPYFVRYKSSAYHGMILKKNTDSSELSHVQIRTKKRFLKRQLLLTFENTPNHPEYSPLKNTQWIIRYRRALNQANKIKNIRVNDFRILPFKKSDYSKKSKEGYYIELKGDNEMFRFAAKPKKKKKVAKAFKKYRKHYRDRVKMFDDSLRQTFNKPIVQQHFQLYRLLRKLSWSRPHPCVRSAYLSPCLNFKMMELALNPSKYLRTSSDDVAPRKPDCPEQKFMDWLRFYNANTEQLHQQIVELRQNLPNYFKCVCGINLDTTSTNQIAPCYKWEYADINSVGEKITYIGLGTYNFDYVFRLDEKQMITNPLFVTTQGDTLRTCWNIGTSKNNPIKCNYELYSIVPNFNGLLKHNFIPRFSLLQKKENILFLTFNNRRYKCYVDMRNKDKFIGNTFIVQDITEQSKTLDGLRNELIK